LAPLTVSVKVPRVAVRVVRTVSVDDPGARTGVGVKLAVAPDGSPVAVRVT
jgi:hypothetical protein